MVLLYLVVCLSQKLKSAVRTEDVLEFTTSILDRVYGTELVLKKFEEMLFAGKLCEKKYISRLHVLL